MNTTTSLSQKFGRVLFRAAMIVAVPSIFLLCALLVVLAQLQGEA